MKAKVIDLHPNLTLVAERSEYYMAFGLGMKLQQWKDSIVGLYGEEVILHEEINNSGDILELTISSNVDLELIKRHENLKNEWFFKYAPHLISSSSSSTGHSSMSSSPSSSSSTSQNTSSSRRGKQHEIPL